MHDIDLSLTTNVSQIFPKRKREIFAPCVDGEEENLHDWFVEDFTCAELKELSVSHQFLTRRFRGGTSGWTSRGVKLEGRLKIPTVFEAARFVLFLLPHTHTHIDYSLTHSLTHSLIYTYIQRDSKDSNTT